MMVQGFLASVMRAGNGPARRILVRMGVATHSDQRRENSPLWRTVRDGEDLESQRTPTRDGRTATASVSSAATIAR